MSAADSADALRLESDRRVALSVVSILLCINLAFVILNLREAGAQLANIPPIVVTRLYACGVAAICFAIFCGVKTQRALETAGFAGSMAVAVLVLCIQLQSPPHDLPGYSFDLVLITTLFVALPSRPFLQLIPAAMMCAGAAVLLHRPESGMSKPDEIRFAIFFIASTALGYISAIRRSELWEDAAAARRSERDAAVDAERARNELQSLRGIIPICSHCHRVRIEDGRLWEAVDMYVSRRTDAAFSHGVCPDCLVEHYPQVRAE